MEWSRQRWRKHRSDCHIQQGTDSRVQIWTPDPSIRPDARWAVPSHRVQLYEVRFISRILNTNRSKMRGIEGHLSSIVVFVLLTWQFHTETDSTKPRVPNTTAIERMPVRTFAIQLPKNKDCAFAGVGIPGLINRRSGKVEIGLLYRVKVRL